MCDVSEAHLADLRGSGHELAPGLELANHEAAIFLLPVASVGHAADCADCVPGPAAVSPKLRQLLGPTAWRGRVFRPAPNPY